MNQVHMIIPQIKPSIKPKNTQKITFLHFNRMIHSNHDLIFDKISAAIFQQMRKFTGIFLDY